MSEYGEYEEYGNFDDVFDPKYGDPHPVPIVMANNETLKGFGNIVTDFDSEQIHITPWPVKGWRKLWPETGTLGGIRSGDFKYKWVGDMCTAVNEAVINGDYVTGKLPRWVSPSNRTHVLVKDANYHPDGSQVFYPKNRDPFVMLLAKPGDDISLESFVAFYCDGSFGVHVHTGVWHQPVYPINDEAEFYGKQGAVHACVGVNTAGEFGKYLLVPLTKPESS